MRLFFHSEYLLTWNMIQYAKNYFVKITICLKFLYLYHILANLGCHIVSLSLGCHIKFHIFFGQNLKFLAIVSGAKTVKKDTFNQVTSHCSFTRLKPERIGSFSFFPYGFPGTLKIFRISVRDFGGSALKGQTFQPILKIAKTILLNPCMKLIFFLLHLKWLKIFL